VRWIQFGAFQPILRLHSNHGRRLPWEYPRPAREIASGFMRLRGSMIPFLYTLARQAYDTGMPLARPMYLEWPRMSAAYRADDQYMLGDSLLVAPVSKPGRVVSRRVWLPPGDWIDIFTGDRLRGGGNRRVRAPLERMPVFARAGSIVPRQPYGGQTGRGQARKLTLDVYAGARGNFNLYEDEGDGYAYEGGAFARTPLRWSETANGARLSIGRTRGQYAGGLKARGYELRIATRRRPAEIELAVRGRTRELHRWRIDREAGRLEIPVGRISTKRPAEVRITFSR
jgi:alpha-glucosidase (family GH31 glycosyl hydrolase)